MLRTFRLSIVDLLTLESVCTFNPVKTYLIAGKFAEVLAGSNLEVWVKCDSTVNDLGYDWRFCSET